MKRIWLFAMLSFMALCAVSCDGLFPDDEDSEGEEEWIDYTPDIEFNDPNFLKALLLEQEIWGYDPETGGDVMFMQKIDRNGDGRISEKEAAYTEGIFLWNVETMEHFEISDVSELKYFTSLKVLDCSGCGLTSVDVSGNPALVDFFCSDNPIEEIDLSMNENLACIEVYRTDISSLDVSGNDKLVYLGCSDNKLTEIDLGYVSSIRQLICENNALTGLDLSSCSELEVLFCDNNGITGLDLDGKTELRCWNISTVFHAA